MGIGVSTLCIQSCKSRISRLEMIATLNNVTLNSLYRYQSVQSALVSSKYEGENELLEVQLQGLDTTNEADYLKYKSILQQQEKLENQQQREIDRIQKEVNLKEKQIEMEQAQNETELSALRQQEENTKALRKEQLKKFAYFK